ncbi:TSUP family transporter [Rhodobacterales bacterium HKCCE2091]|nr:TSUP family transporter [Rhodobacterales bacterium HKCCE2091]
MTVLIALAAVGSLLLGAVVKGVLGIGLPMVAIPLLTLVAGLPQALAIVSLPVAAANLMQVWQFRRAGRKPRVLWPFLLAGAAGTAAGTVILANVHEAWLELILSVLLAVYIAMRLLRSVARLGDRGATAVAAPAGLAAGLLHGTTGISGPLSITFFHAQRPERPEFILATGLVFLVFTLVQIPMLGATGIFGAEAALAGLAGLPAVAAGLWLGNRLARRMSARVFDRLILAVLCWTAGALAWRAIPALLGA